MENTMDNYMDTGFWRVTLEGWAQGRVWRNYAVLFKGGVGRA